MALDLEMVRGKTGLFSITATQSDGVTPQSLSGMVLWFHARFKGRANGVNYDIQINKYSPSNGITITDEAGGLATLEIDPSETEDIPDVSPARGVYVGPCDLILKDGSAEYPLDIGTLTIKTNIGDE